MATPNTPGQTPEELLQAAQDDEQQRQEQRLANRILDLPADERARKLESMIRDGARALDISDDKMDRFVSSIMDKIEEGEKKASVAAQTKIFNDFKGRFQLLNGKWFPAGLRRNAKMKIENDEVLKEAGKVIGRGTLNRMTRTILRLPQITKLIIDASDTIPVEDVDRVVNRYVELNQAIERNKDDIDKIKKALKSSDEWGENKK